MVRLYFMFFVFFSSLFGIQESNAGFVPDEEKSEVILARILKSKADLPNQEDQKNACVNFNTEISSENYNTLQTVSEKNFGVIFNTIVGRFGEGSKQYKDAEETVSKVSKVLSSGKMNTRKLTKLYFEIAESLTTARPRPLSKGRLKRLVVLPVPIVSEDGIAAVATIGPVPLARSLATRLLGNARWQRRVQPVRNCEIPGAMAPASPHHRAGATKPVS